jgi:hypothetical protein
MIKLMIALFLMFSHAAFAESPIVWSSANGVTLAQILNPAQGIVQYDGKQIRALSVNPSSGGGVAAPIGSLGQYNASGTGQLWLKTGSGNTSWTQVAAGGSGITSINGDTTAAQLITAASTGTDFTISTAGGTTTVAIPSASATARGLVTTGSQTIAGNKTFSGSISASNLTGTNTGDQTITLTGDVTGSGTGSFASTLATVNTNIGTFASSTVNGKGLITAAANLTGDATTSGSALTLATVNSNVGSFTNASITVNGKGLITAASSGSATTPGGSNTQIQYNDSSAFNGDAALTFTKATGVTYLKHATSDGGGSGANSERFGVGANGTGASQTLLGDNAFGSSGASNVCIGHNSSCSNSTGGQDTIIGTAAVSSLTANGANAGIGYSLSMGFASAAVGWSVTCGKAGVCLGAGAAATDNVTGLDIVIGRSSTDTQNSNLLIGTNIANTTGTNQAIFGSATTPYTQWYLGSGKSAAAPSAITVQATPVVTGTSNTAGVNFTLAAGNGTGTGGSGAINFQTAPVGSTGSTPNTLATVVSISNKGAINSSAPQTVLTATGTATFSEPFQGASYKKVIIFLNAFTDTGTQTYTYPTAFTNTPYVYGLSAGVAGATASTSSVSFTVTGATGLVFLEGY